MARPCKAVVDYFPHYCESGRTLFILEEEWGNDGYVFLFKMLELLGKTENHFIDCNNHADWLFLLSKTRLQKYPDIATDILNTLASLETIDAELWKLKIIWSANFVANLTTVYNRRNITAFGKPDIVDYCKQKYPDKRINVDRNPQSKVNYSKLKETEATKSVEPRTFFEKFWEVYPKKKSKGEAEKAFHRLDLKNGLFERIVQALSLQKQTEDWIKEGGKYIPHPATWLNAKGWEDELRPEAHVPTEKELQDEKDRVERKNKADSDKSHADKMKRLTPEQRKKVLQKGDDLRTGKTTIGELLGKGK